MINKIKNYISCHLFNQHDDYVSFISVGGKILRKKTCKKCWRDKFEDYTDISD